MALLSLLTDRRFRSDTVLPVGGIKEKVVAAAEAGMTRVMLPARNRRDYDDIPSQARHRLDFFWLDTVDQAAEATPED